MIARDNLDRIIYTWSGTIRIYTNRMCWWLQHEFQIENSASSTGSDHGLQEIKHGARIRSLTVNLVACRTCLHPEPRNMAGRDSGRDRDGSAFGFIFWFFWFVNIQVILCVCQAAWLEGWTCTLHFDICLVGGLEHFIFSHIFGYIWNNHPNWLIFFGGFETTSQKLIQDMIGIQKKIMKIGSDMLWRSLVLHMQIFR